MKRTTLLTLMVFSGFYISAQCYDSSKITSTGKGSSEKFYIKSSMNLVNGCVTTINKNNDSRGLSYTSGNYKKHKLQIKNGKLTYLHSWYKNGQLKLKSKFSNGDFINPKCYSEFGEIYDCSNESIKQELTNIFSGKLMLLD